MMDALSYIALGGLQLDLRRDLELGTMPIGHLPRGSGFVESSWKKRRYCTSESGGR
jgi:hypothetical protein